jgi:hypothetical protein
MLVNRLKTFADPFINQMKAILRKTMANILKKLSFQTGLKICSGALLGFVIVHASTKINWKLFFQHKINFCDSPQKMLEDLLSCLRSVQTVNAYWELMEKDGPFEIRFATEFEKVIYLKGSCAATLTRTILLDKDEFSKPFTRETFQNSLETILFELCNLQHWHISTNPHDFETADEFAYHMEYAEYKSWCQTSRMLESMVNEKQIPFHNYQQMTLDDYLLLQDANCHSDIYREAWYTACDPKGKIVWQISMYPKWIKYLNTHTQFEKKKKL